MKKKIIEFITIIKENNFAALFDSEGKPFEIPGLWLIRYDRHKKSIFDWILELDYQPILDFVYYQIFVNQMIYGALFLGSQLYYAVCCHQSLEEISKLLENDNNLTAKYSVQQVSAIHAGAQAGHLDFVKYAIEIQPSLLNEADAWGHTPLIYAVKSGKKDIVKFLLDQKGIDVNAVVKKHPRETENGKSALHFAAEYGQDEMIDLLLAAGADIKLKTTNMQYLALHLSAQFNNLKSMKLLITADPKSWDEPDGHGQTALVWAASEGHDEIVEFLLDKTNALTFILSQKKQQKENIDLHAISKNFAMTKNNPDGKTALHWACEKGQYRVVPHLLAAGANPNLLCAMGYQPIHLACIYGQFAVIRILLDVYPDLINATDRDGFTPLMWSAHKKNFELVIFLLSIKGVNINAKANASYQHKMAINFAAEQGVSEIVDLLLQSKAKLDLQNPISTHSLSEAVKSEVIHRENLLKFSMFHEPKNGRKRRERVESAYAASTIRKNSF